MCIKSFHPMESFRSTAYLKPRFHRWKKSASPIKILINFWKIWGLDFSLSTHLEIKWRLKVILSIFSLYNTQINKPRRSKVAWVTKLKRAYLSVSRAGRCGVFLSTSTQVATRKIMLLRFSLQHLTGISWSLQTVQNIGECTQIPVCLWLGNIQC